MKINFKVKNVCAKSATVILSEDRRIIYGVELEGGCDGHSKTLNALLAGMTVADAIQRLKDIQCGKRKTSCPAELVNGLAGVIDWADR